MSTTTEELKALADSLAQIAEGADAIANATALHMALARATRIGGGDRLKLGTPGVAAVSIEFPTPDDAIAFFVAADAACRAMKSLTPDEG